MSITVGKFKVHYTDDLPCRSPYSDEVLTLRNAGLDPTDWLVVESPARLPFVVLKQRSGKSLAILEGFELKEEML